MDVIENKVRLPILNQSVPAMSKLGDIDVEAELAKFEREQMEALGFEPGREHWRDDVPQKFTADERDHTTILLGGLTLAHDYLVTGALEGLGYKVQALECPDLAFTRAAMPDVAVDRRRVRPVGLDCDDVESVMLDQPARDGRSRAIEFARAVARLAKQHHARIAIAVEHRSERRVVDFRQRLRSGRRPVSDLPHDHPSWYDPKWISHACWKKSKPKSTASCWR